jgi:hypothetical protein
VRSVKHYKTHMYVKHYITHMYVKHYKPHMYVKHYVTHMYVKHYITPTTGQDPDGIRVRGTMGMEAADYLIPGFWIWAKVCVCVSVRESVRV